MEAPRGEERADRTPPPGEVTRTDHRGLRFLQEPADRVADCRDRGGLDRFERTPVDGPRSHRIEVVGLHYLGRHDPGLASDPHADRSRYKRRRGDGFEHVAGRLPNIEKVPPQTGERHAARFPRGHAPADVLLDVQLQVRLQLWGGVQGVAAPRTGGVAAGGD